MPDTVTGAKANFLISDDNKYISFNGTQYEVCFRSATGKESVVKDPQQLKNIVSILKATFSDPSKVDLRTTVLVQEGIRSSTSTLTAPYPKNPKLLKKVDDLFKGVHNVYKFKTPETIPTERTKSKPVEPKTTFDPKVEFPALINCGNSCYMDATLEMLLSIKEFVLKKINEAKAEKLNNQQQLLIRRLKEFFDAVETGNKAKVDQAQKSLYAHLLTYKVFGQPFELDGKTPRMQDAPEFLEKVLEVIGYSVPREITQYGTPIEFLGGRPMNIINPTDINTRILSIDLARGGKTLSDVLKAHADYTAEPKKMEIIDGQHCVNYSETAKIKLKKDQQPEDVIFVQMARWDDEGNVCNHEIDFSKDYSVINLSHLYEEPHEGRNFNYQVVGVVNISGMHYTAKVRHESTGDWHHCNDLSNQNDALSRSRPFTSNDHKKGYLIALRRLPA